MPAAFHRNRLRPRNIVKVDSTKGDTFQLLHGPRCEVIAETHDGDTSTLTIRRLPRHLDPGAC